MAAGPCLARRRLHPTTACRLLALPWAIRQHARLPGAPPSWRQDPCLARRRLHPPPPRPAGCWRSHGRSGSTHDSRERRHLGGRTLPCKTAPPSPTPTASRMLALPWAIRQHARLPGAPPSWRQDLALQDGASIPHPHGQQDAGAPMGDQAARTTPGSAAILAAGPCLARRRLHPSTTASRMLALPGSDQAARTTPGSAAILAAGSWLARRRLHPSTTASRMLALPIGCQSRESCQTIGPALFHVQGR